MDKTTEELIKKGMFNSDQVDYMRYLDSLPKEAKCVSGWHVLAQEKCDCAEQRKEAGR